MTPYYEQSGITIYHGDCRDVLPTLGPVDLVLTDPPYGVGKTYASHDDSAALYREWLASVQPLIFAASARQLITCGVANIWRWPPADWVIGWFKSNAMTRSAIANANVWEPVLVYGCKGFGVDGRAFPITPQPFDHPCPKPLGLFQWLLVEATKPDAVVLDCFCGSGTTLEAAKNLRLRAIGIELEEKYCEIAAERLRQEALPLEVA